MSRVSSEAVDLPPSVADVSDEEGADLHMLPAAVCSEECDDAMLTSAAADLPDFEGIDFSELPPDVDDDGFGNDSLADAAFHNCQ